MTAPYRNPGAASAEPCARCPNAENLAPENRRRILAGMVVLALAVAAALVVADILAIKAH
jgi:hypothetical protein